MGDVLLSIPVFVGDVLLSIPVFVGDEALAILVFVADVSLAMLVFMADVWSEKSTSLLSEEFVVSVVVGWVLLSAPILVEEHAENIVQIISNDIIHALICLNFFIFCILLL